jgi:hypothetical protein
MSWFIGFESGDEWLFEGFETWDKVEGLVLLRPWVSALVLDA